MKTIILPLRVALLLPALLVSSALGQATIPAAGSGNWTDNTTWSGGVVPGTADTAQINGSGIVLDADISVGSLQLMAGTLGGTGHLAVAGNLTWGPGAFFSSTGGLELRGNSTLGAADLNAHEYLYAGGADVTLDNYGSLTVLSLSNDYGLYDNGSGHARINNQPGATVTLTGGASLRGLASSLFTNAAGATLVHTGAGSSLIDLSVTNNGTVDVQAGEVRLTNANYGGTGNATVAAGANLAFINETVTSAATVSGSGTVTLTGTDTFNGTTQLPDTILNGTVNGSGQLAIAGNFTWGPGSFFSATGGLELQGNSTLGAADTNAHEYLYAGGADITLDNYGNLTVLSLSNNYGLYDNGSGHAQVNNQPGATITLAGGASLRGTATSLFTNSAGALLVHTGTGSSLIDMSVTNNGTINVSAGEVRLVNANYGGSGNVTVAAGASLALSGETVTDPTTVAGGGTVTLTGTNTFNGPTQMPDTILSGTVNGPGRLIVTGNFTWGAGMFFSATGGLELHGNSTLGTADMSSHEYLYAGGTDITLDNYGNLTVLSLSNDYGLYDNGSGHAQVNNLPGATVTLSGGASLRGLASSLFTNAAGATLVHTGSGSSLIDMSFTNNGTVSLSSGQMRFSGDTLGGTGTINLAPAAWLHLAGVTQTGTQTVSSDNGTLTLLGLSGPGELHLTGMLNLGGATYNQHEFLHSVVTNAGNVTFVPYADGGAWSLNDEGAGDAAWVNQAGSTFTLANNANILGNATSTFTNAAGANFAKTGPIQSLVYWGFTNNGTVTVNDGLLGFISDPLAGTGNFTVGPAGVLHLQSVTLSGTQTVNGTAGSMLRLYHLSGGGELHLTGTLNLGGATYNQHEFLHSVVTNAGNVTFVPYADGGQWSLNDNGAGDAAWVNQAGSTFTLANNANLLGNATSSFTNAVGATFAKTGPVQSTVQWGFTNNGTITINDGVLSFVSDTLGGTGNLTVGPAGWLDLSSVNQTGMQTVNGAAGSTLTLYYLNGGGELHLTGTLNLGTPGYNFHEYLHSLVTNAGNVTFVPYNDGGQWSLNDNGAGDAAWVNQAGSTFTLANNANLLGNATSSFTNAVGATFAKTGPVQSTVQWGFTNNGTITINDGVLSFVSDTLGGTGNLTVGPAGWLDLSSVNQTGMQTVNGAAGSTLTLYYLNGGGELHLTGTLNLGTANRPYHEYLHSLVTNAGNVTFIPYNDGGQWSLNDNGAGDATWINQGGGTYLLANNANILGSANSTFTNQAGATFAKNGEVVPGNWTGRIVNPKSAQRSLCQRNDVSTVPI